jgi:hypothetical protein
VAAVRPSKPKSAGAWQGPPAPPRTAAIEGALGKADRAKTMAADVLKRTAPTTPAGAVTPTKPKRPQ